MTKLVWDAPGTRTYETGVDHGVLYIPNSVGEYIDGVAWNGLTTVTASPGGAEPNPVYADNIKYLNLMSAEDFSATIEALTYPDEFLPFDGQAEIAPGVYAGQQARGTFGFSYRTLIGSDLNGQDHGYKIHLIYGCTASPSERTATTINESPEAVTMSWEISTVPEAAPEGFRPTAEVVIDSTKTDLATLGAFEDIIYGTAGSEPRLPTVIEVADLLGASSVVTISSAAPTINTSTNVITIPTVTGLDYYIGSTKLTSGAQDPITATTVVRAKAKAGYRLTPTSDTDWTMTFTP